MHLPRSRRFQPLWERLHAAALAGMNFADDDQETNGELWLLEWLSERLGPSPVVFDVGGNVGGYSMAVLEQLPGARLFSFEPSATLIVRWRRRCTVARRPSILRLALRLRSGRCTPTGPVRCSGRCTSAT